MPQNTFFVCTCYAFCLGFYKVRLHTYFGFIFSCFIVFIKLGKSTELSKMASEEKDSKFKSRPMSFIFCCHQQRAIGNRLEN